MTIANNIRNSHVKLNLSDNPEIPINENALLHDCAKNGYEIREGVFIFNDESILDTIDFHVLCYKTITEYYLQNKGSVLFMDEENEEVKRIVPFPNTIEGAKQYISSKNIEKGTCKCADCGKNISMSGSTCFSFGIYLCDSCKVTRSEL